MGNSFETGNGENLKEIRLGFVGVGDQGSTHLDSVLGIPIKK